MKVIAKILIILTVIFPKHILAQTNTHSANKMIASKADTLLTQAIAHGEHAGMTIGILCKDQIVYSDGRGCLDLQRNLKADETMESRTASITKPMTSVAILQLYEQGRIDLDVPIQHYLPNFPRKWQGNITVRMLLGHTSGIPHYKGMLDGFSFRNYANCVAAMERFADRDLEFVPGSEYQYSTYGYVLLGAIIEMISGQSYGDYMRDNIWVPAGMTHTYIDRNDATLVNRSKLYRSKNGKIKKDLNTNLSMKASGGGVVSTSSDLLRFGQSLLGGDLLKSKTLEMMIADQGVREKAAGNPYGLGWYIYEDAERGKIIGHSGSQAGSSAQLMIAIDSGVIVSVLSNTRNQWDKVFRLSWQLLELCLSEEARNKKLHKAISLSKDALNTYTGKYRFQSGRDIEIFRKGDQLYSKMDKYPALKLFAEENHVLFYRILPGHFEFEVDASGAVTGTVYTQNGKTIEVERLK